MGKKGSIVPSLMVDYPDSGVHLMGAGAQGWEGIPG